MLWNIVRNLKVLVNSFIRVFHKHSLSTATVQEKQTSPSFIRLVSALFRDATAHAPRKLPLHLFPDNSQTHVQLFPVQQCIVAIQVIHLLRALFRTGKAFRKQNKAKDRLLSSKYPEVLRIGSFNWSSLKPSVKLGLHLILCFLY